MIMSGSVDFPSYNAEEWDKNIIKGIGTTEDINVSWIEC